jgi:hypothetical protein
MIEFFLFFWPLFEGHKKIGQKSLNQPIWAYFGHFLPLFTVFGIIAFLRTFALVLLLNNKTSEERLGGSLFAFGRQQSCLPKA